MASPVMVGHHPATDMDRPQPAATFSEAVPTILVAGSLFQSQVVDGVYAGLGHPLPYGWPLLSSVCVAMSIIVWFRIYSRRHGVAWVMDMAWFLLAAWFILVPYYILKREGRRGLSRIGLFCLTYLAAWATGVAVRIWIRVLSPS